MSNTYKGVALPWGPSVSSFIEPKDDDAILRSSVIFIVLTGLGERVMLPEFGSNLPGSVFEPNDNVLAGLIGNSVREALRRWDDRVELVDFQAERPDDHSLLLKIVWKNLNDPLSKNLQVLQLQVTDTGIRLL